MNKFKKVITGFISLVLLCTVSGCKPKVPEKVEEFLNTPIIAESINQDIDMLVNDGEQFQNVVYECNSDKVVIVDNDLAKITPSIEACEVPVTVSVYNRKTGELIATKDNVIKIYPAQYYAAEIIARGWETNRKENFIYYEHLSSGQYGNNVTAGTSIYCTFSFDTMVLSFTYSSGSYNSDSNESNVTKYQLYYSAIEHKIYDDEGNFLYTDRANTSTVIPAGTDRFLTHIEDIDRYFTYINATEYLSGLKSKNVSDLF